MVTDEDKEAIRKFKEALGAFNDAVNGLSAQRIQVSFLDGPRYRQGKPDADDR